MVAEERFELSLRCVKPRAMGYKRGSNKTKTEKRGICGRYLQRSLISNVNLCSTL